MTVEKRDAPNGKLPLHDKPSGKRFGFWATMIGFLFGLSAFLGRPTYREFFSSDSPEDAARKQLAALGVQWSERSFGDAFAQKDSKLLSLFLDGGYHIGRWQFIAFTENSFDATVAEHFQQGSIDPVLVCPKPHVEPDANKALHPFTHNVPISADLWYWQVPDFYLEVKALHDENRVLFVRRMCGVPAVLFSFADFPRMLTTPSSLSASELADVARWREAFTVLTSDRPTW